MTKYTAIQLRDYDKVFKVGDRPILCFSRKAFKAQESTPRIIGEVNNYGNGEKAEVSVAVGSKIFAVCEPGKANRLLYVRRGYVMVGKEECIAFNRSILPFLLSLLGLILAALLLLLLLLKFVIPVRDAEVLHPLPPIDINVKMEPDEGKQSTAIEGNGGSVTMTLRPSATLHLSEGTIDIYFMNPHDSTHDIALDLYVVTTENGVEKEYKISESGRIPIGGTLEIMTLSANPVLFVEDGIYLARYYVRCYDPETGEKAIVDPYFDDISLIIED